VANIGRFGPYVNHDGKFKSIPKTLNVFEIDNAGAAELIAQAHTGPAPLADLGEHPSREGRVEVFDGRYGPYVQHKKVRATLPKSIAPEELSFEEAIVLLAEKEAKATPAKKKRAPAKKPAAKKPAAKKASVKKPAAKKASVKKKAE